ncbi:hypothetical protein MRX96_026173 [Rhipicephalus microplus]
MTSAEAHAGRHKIYKSQNDYGTTYYDGKQPNYYINGFEHHRSGQPQNYNDHCEAVQPGDDSDKRDDASEDNF